MMETVYNVGDEVTINDISWKVSNIRNRFGRVLVYDMNRSDGGEGHITIETGSLETLMEMTDD